MLENLLLLRASDCRWLVVENARLNLAQKRS